MGKKYEIEMETISKPYVEYRTDEYLKSGLPKAPAIIIDDEIVVEGSDMAEDKLENIIRSHLGLPPLESEKKGVLGRLFGQ